MWVATSTYELLIPTIFDQSRSIAHVQQIDATSPFQMANSGARSIHCGMQQQARISAALNHKLIVSLFTIHRVPKEVRDWQMATDASSAETIEIGNRNELVGKANCNRCQG